MAQAPTLYLNMIVKNESRIIKRLLDSVRPIIDGYCICDTGSTDDTVRIIQDYFAEANLPGKIVTEPFVNFEHNRNAALQAASGMSDFVLLLDADMVLEIGTSFDKAKVLSSMDNACIRQGTDDYHYHNVRIVRNDGQYRYVGVTHEYINTPDSHRRVDINKDVLFIRDIGDGGSKSEKFNRDIRLLTTALETEPTNVRYHFYLANSYHDTGRWEEAIDCYKKRIALGGWKEEVWYSHYRIGLCYQRMGRMADAIHEWMIGYEFHPQRLEGLYEIIKYHRTTSQYRAAMLYYNAAKSVLQLRHNRNSFLFLGDDVYLYKLQYECLRCAFYTGVDHVREEVVDILNHSPDDAMRNNVLFNMKFYKDVLKPTIVLSFDDRVTRTIHGHRETFISSSSSLLPHPDTTSGQYIMNVRYVNYTIDHATGVYSPTQHIISLNKQLTLDGNFQVLSEKWKPTDFDGRMYEGVEDVRLFVSKENGRIQYVGTGYHRNNQLGIVTGEYDDANGQTLRELKQSFKKTACEKNWVPVEYQGETRYIYEWHPLRLCRETSRDNPSFVEMVEDKPMPKIFRHIRGSTPGFRTTNGEIWFVTHIVSYETPREYYHMLVVFDKDLSPSSLQYTAPFKFTHDAAIEYCLSIVVEDKRVMLNYSTWDSSTRVAIYDRDYLRSLLLFPPSAN